MEEERQVEERLLSEAPENLKIYVGRAGEVQPPSTATGRDFTGDRPPTDGEHVAGRARLPGCGVAIWEDAAGGEVTPSTESEEAAENLRERSTRSQACGPEEIPIPSRSWPTSSCEILWRSDRTGGGGTAD